MTTMPRLFAAATAMLTLAACQAHAQSFPTQPVRVVVPFPAGGGTDILMRLIQDKLSARLGQPVVIDNRPGASGNIGSGVVAKSNPDGYTLIVQGTIVGIYPRVFASLPYDPLKDFAYIGGVAESPAVIVVNANSKLNTIGDLIGEGKTRPLNFASAGVGAPQHLATERLARHQQDAASRTFLTRARPPPSPIFWAGCSISASLSLSSVLPLIQEGKLRALAVASDNRSKLLPNVPTIKEAGFGDVSGTIRFFLAAPADTPQATVDKLSRDLAAVVKRPGNPGRLRQARLRDHVWPSPKEVLAMVREQGKLWAPIIEELKLKFD